MLNPKLPDGPQTHPLIQTIQWLMKPLEFMETNAKKYGDIFTVRIGPLFIPQVFISNPQAIKEIFTTDPQKLDSGEAAGIKLPLLGEQSLLALEGQPHRRQRKLLTPPFHGERMKTYGNLIQEITEEVAQGWKIGEPFPVLISMQAISFKIILKAVFGLKEGDRYDKLKDVLLAILNPKRPIVSALLFLFPLLQKDLGAWSPWGRFLRQREKMNELIYAEIRELKENPDPSRTDILSLMMAARYEDGESMTDEELRDELITLLVAGHETTATALAWALYWIHHLPEVREKLLQELATWGENPESDEIVKLPYLNAVCQETLRIYPVAMLALNRLVKSPLEITGYQFQPDTVLLPNIYLTHHREDLYPDSKQFKPERFLFGQFASYEFMPFGGGNRRCIGMALAMYEMKLVLATLLSRWQLELADNKPVVPVRKGALLGPAKGVPMVLKKTRFQDQKIDQTTLISA